MTDSEHVPQSPDNPDAQTQSPTAGAFPITLQLDDDLKRSRLTVLFRWLLAIPHFIWWYLWGIAAFLVAFVNWIATTIAGQSPDALHNFLAGFMRYSVHLSAYLNILANPYPGFSSTDAYPLSVDIAPPAKQGRLGVFFRWILAIPAWIIAGVLGWALGIIALLAWIIAIIMGRMPEGLQDIGTYILRYQTETHSYSYLLTNRYPRLSV